MNGSSLNKDDVVNIELNRSFVGATTFTVGEACEKLARFIGDKNNYTGEVCKQWREGIECRVLRTDSKGWKKGKVRISLEFIPDKPDNELTPTSTDAVMGGEHRTEYLREKFNKDSNVLDPNRLP